MATGQSLLDLMEVLNAELQLQSGEADVTRGLRALNASQDFFETQLALHTDTLGDTAGDVTTTASQETTTFPTGVLRIDRLQFINPSTSRPAWDLAPIRRKGGHSANSFWPWNIVATGGAGRPRGYYTSGRLIYWDPLPDGTHTVRWYGLKAADDLTAGGTFSYPDAAMLPIAQFAVMLMKQGVDDPIQDAAGLARQLFDPVIQTLGSFHRDGPRGLEYRYIHET
jgi:hypothetical protein